METIQKFSDKTVQSLIELGRQTAGPQQVQTVPGNPVPFIIVNGEVKLLPGILFNEYAERPQRIKANVSVLDPESFVEYYKLFSDANSRVFAYEPEMKVLAILDYHAGAPGEPISPRWGQHRVTLSLRHSEEWLRWVNSNNNKFTQGEFAEFLEQNSIDIINPPPAAMMEVARDLNATTNVEFGAGVRMNDGQTRFRYTETTNASVGAGQLAVPDQFVIQIPVFIGGPRIPMQALLRFRVNQGKLVIWYTLVRPEEVKRTAFVASRQQIADTLQVNIINGNPQ